MAAFNTLCAVISMLVMASVVPAESISTDLLAWVETTGFGACVDVTEAGAAAVPILVETSASKSGHWVNEDVMACDAGPGRGVLVVTQPTVEFVGLTSTSVVNHVSHRLPSTQQAVLVTTQQAVDFEVQLSFASLDAEPNESIDVFVVRPGYVLVCRQLVRFPS